MTLDDTVMPSNQVRFIALMTVFLCFFTFLLVRWQTRTLRRLAKAAVNLGKDIDQPSLKEEGPPDRGGHPRLQHHAAPHPPLYRR